MKNLISVILITMIPLCIWADEEKAGFVDVNATNELIASIKRDIEIHEVEIGGNERERAQLEEEIIQRETRLESIERDLTTSKESNRELNELYKVTEDRKAKEEIENTRSELLSILWILNNEKEDLIALNLIDRERIDFLKSDTERRKSIIASKREEIPSLEESVKISENKINEIYSRLNEISSSLSEIRNETGL